jgi:putative transposase
MSVQEGIGKVAAACRALGLSRSSYYRSGRSSLESRRIRKEVLELSAQHPRYGYRRITALMRREGFEVNAKRVARIRREEGMKVSKKQRRMKRLGISTAERQRAERPGQVWSWDFVADQTETGSSFRILTLLDEHTRQCLAIHPAWSIRAVDVITVIEAAIASNGVPEHLRSDNGPEFIASCMQDWLKAQEIKTLYIKPGSPWENGHIGELS